MASVGDSKRRVVATFQRKQAIRQDLFNELRGRQIYRNALALLGNQWKKSARGGQDCRRFSDIEAAAKHGRDGLLAGYVSELRRVVAQDLRLVERGDRATPVDWACNYLHCDVEPTSLAAGPDPNASRPEMTWHEKALLSIFVSALGARVAVTREDVESISERSMMTPLGYGEAEWDQFFKDAHALLEECLQGMRTSYEDSSLSLDHFKMANPSTRRRERQDMQLLVSVLLGNQGPSPRDCPRLEKRAELLGIAFPPPSRSVVPKKHTPKLP